MCIYVRLLSYATGCERYKFIATPLPLPGQGQGVQIQMLRFGPMTQQVQVILDSISFVFFGDCDMNIH